MTELPKLYTAKDIADALRRTKESTVKERARKGEYPHVRVGRRNIIAFTREQYDEIIRMGERPATSGPAAAAKPSRTGSRAGAGAPRRRTAAPSTAVEPLRARPPRRKRKGGGPDAA
ncbi:hypothetical protein [Nocardiopsis nanhaiensis]